MKRVRRNKPHKNNDGKRTHFVFPFLAIILCVCIVGYVIADYFDLPSRFGVSSSRLNTDYLGIVVGAFITLFLFVLTYYFVERWNINKYNNQRRNAQYLLRKTYDTCLYDLNLLHNGALNQLVKITDFNKRYYHDGPVERYCSMAFENEELIFQFVNSGSITSDEFKDYLDVKKIWSEHASMCVTLFDHLSMVTPTREEVENAIKKAINSLTALEKE